MESEMHPRPVKRTILLAGTALLLFLAGQGVERLALLANGAGYARLCSWDCRWYGSIVDAGYDLEPHAHAGGDAANWGFFPLFPLSARIVRSVTGLPRDLALVATGKLFFLTAIFCFILFARAWLPECGPWVAGSVVAFHPYSIYGNTGYSESLFLTLSCLCLYCIKRDRYVLAGFVGGLLSGTRVVGASAGLAYLARIVRRRAQLENPAEILFGLCLVPAGLAVFMAYLHFRMGDALAFSHVRIAWGQEPGNLLRDLESVFQGSTAAASAAASAVVALLAMVQLARMRQYELLLFSLAATGLPLLTGLSSMPRFVWWQAPVLLAAASVAARRPWFLPLYLAASLLVSHALYRAWVHGSSWVI